MAVPVFDGHNDVLLAERSFLEPSDDGHLELPRARAGGFAGGFFAIFTPHPDGFPDDARRDGEAARARGRRTAARGARARRPRAAGRRAPVISALVLDDLRALGWAEPELRLVAHENFLRVLRQVQNAASSRARPTGSS